MSIKIEKIRPSYDQDSGRDILEFTVNGEDRTEYLDGSYLGIDNHNGGSLYLLDEDHEEAEREEIHSQLEKWISENRHERFARKSDNPDVESVEHGLNVSHGNIAVWLTNAAAERLNLFETAFEITADGSISWTDRDHGDQYYENGAGGDQAVMTLRDNLAQPETCICDIESRLAQLREENGDEYSAESIQSLTI